MSEFKFACPVCGQHISGDDSISGTQIACPTCFQTIIVPQAPSLKDTRLILTAAQPPRRRPDTRGLTVPLQSHERPSRWPTVLLVLVLIAAAVAAWWWWTHRS